MAVVFNSTVGTVGFNAYCTVAEATDYATTKNNTAFALLTTPVKEASIIWATRQLNTLQWVGSLTVATQPNEWPRTGVWRDGGTHDVDYYSATQFDPTTIPQFLKDATADLALQLSAGDTTAPTGTEGFSRIKVSEIELVMNAKDRLAWFTDSTRNLCWRYLLNSSKYNTPVVRVG
jgi:hypothetical protein